MQYVSTFLINTCNFGNAYVCFTTISYIVYALLLTVSDGKGEKQERYQDYLYSLARISDIIHRNVFSTPFLLRGLNK